MSKPLILASAVASLLLSGCYTTRVETRTPVSGVYDDRQWFLLWGAVRVSDPAGKECPDGVAFSESKIGVLDYLINAAIVLGTGVGLSAACDTPACRSAAFSVGGFAGSIIGTRTVTYGCRQGSVAMPYRPAPRPAASQPDPMPEPTPAATSAKSKSRDEICLDSDFCSKYGRCASDGKRCVATSDAGCKLSLGCQSAGKCRSSGGECVK